MKHGIERLVVTLCAVVTVQAAAHAQKYPAKPVRMIVPYVAGGPVDLVGRLVAQRLTERWGQPVLVDNRVGAGGRRGLVSRRPDCGKRRIGPRDFTRT